MGAFYGTKIRNGEVNPKTGEPWKLEDVPTYWREKTADWLKTETVADKD